MSFWSSIVGGTSVKTMPRDPTFEGMNQGLYDFNPRKSYAEKMDKKLLKRMAAGEDVSSYGELNSMRQREAANLAGVDMDYMTGANALAAQSGGDQANLNNRMRDLQKEKVMQQGGMDMVDALTGLRETSANRLTQSKLARQGMRLAAMGQAAGNQLGYYGQRYRLAQQPGLLDTLANLAQGAGGLMTGIGAL